MASDSYDVLILGGGNAGFGVTVPTREAGLKVALVEERDLGGTCPNRGCTPKKVLVAAGHALHEISQAHVHGISVGKPALDWAALIDREKELISGIPDSLAETLENRGVTLFRDHAHFVGPNVVKVGGPNHRGEAHRHRHGLQTPAPAHPGRRAHDHLRRSVERDGSGPAACCSWAAASSPSNSVTSMRAPGPRSPSSKCCRASCRRSTKTRWSRSGKRARRIGIDVHTGVKVVRVEQAGGQLRTVFEADGKSHAVLTDRVINGAGRIANVEHLDLDAGGIQHDGFRIAVDEHLRSTSNQAVYACGDVLSGPPQLSPIATYEGRIVGRNIVEGPKHKADYASLPSAVYTVPALASVGLTEAQAKEKGFKTKVTVSDMEYWFSTRTYAETRAWAKVIVDAETDQILGAHMVGHASEELINIFGLAKAHGITAAQLRDFIFAYPSFSADIKHML